MHICSRTNYAKTKVYDNRIPWHDNLSNQQTQQLLLYYSLLLLARYEILL